jgi:DNA topoisomerase-3
MWPFSRALDNECLTRLGLQVTARNYLEIYPYDKWSDNYVPEMERGDTFIPKACMMSQGRTSPPLLLSEADLIATMDKNGIGW